MHILNNWGFPNAPAGEDDGETRSKQQVYPQCVDWEEEMEKPVLNSSDFPDALAREDDGEPRIKQQGFPRYARWGKPVSNDRGFPNEPADGETRSR